MPKGQGTNLQKVAREALGFTLRPEQLEAAKSVVGGRDTLVVMPTGSGKSAIYQVAAQQLAGSTVVVSPLIALQRDQVDAIGRTLLGAAAEANVTVSEGRRAATLEDLHGGKLEFLFVAPEQFGSEDMLEDLRRSNVFLFVVDEAHCISAWGHDFRPDYLTLGRVVEALGRPTVLAMTATASPPVRREIVERLGMREPHILVHGFDRPNICLEAHLFHDEDTKRDALLQQVLGTEGPGIVYVATRRCAEDLSSMLDEAGRSARHYHGGMKSSERDWTQDAFMRDEIEVVVATTAFGMGIDKPNVRFVFHYHIPESLDSYYQEIGRAGRDGEPACAVLFFRHQDLGLRRFFAAGGKIDARDLEDVLDAVEQYGDAIDPDRLVEDVAVSRSKLTVALAELERADTIDVNPDGRVERDHGKGTREGVDAAAHAQDVHKQVEQSRIEMMRTYAESDGCRRQFLLNYFGESYDVPCDNCDNCLHGKVSCARDVESTFPIGSSVEHEHFGTGRVVRSEQSKVTVLFEDVGYKTLLVEAVTTNGTLRLASA